MQIKQERSPHISLGMKRKEHPSSFPLWRSGHRGEELDSLIILVILKWVCDPSWDWSGSLWCWLGLGFGSWGWRAEGKAWCLCCEAEMCPVVMVQGRACRLHCLWGKCRCSAPDTHFSPPKVRIFGAQVCSLPTFLAALLASWHGVRTQSECM